MHIPIAQALADYPGGAELAASVDALPAVLVQGSVLDSFKPYLNGRLADGGRNANPFLAEVTGQRG